MKKYEYHIYRLGVTWQGKELVSKGLEIADKLKKAYGNASRGARIVLEEWAKK